MDEEALDGLRESHCRLDAALNAAAGRFDEFSQAARGSGLTVDVIAAEFGLSRGFVAALVSGAGFEEALRALVAEPAHERVDQVVTRDGVVSYLTTGVDLVPDGADWAIGWIETDRD